MATIAGAAIVAGGTIYAANQSKKAANKAYRGNDALYRDGVNIANEGLAGVRRLGDGYESILKSGRSVLPDATQNVLRRARGMIADRSVRDTMASGARLRQARIASRGRLTEEAAQAYMIEAEAEANRAERESALALDSQEAELELVETNTLRNRLAQAREAILGEGRARWSAGLGGANGALAQQAANSAQIGQMLAQLGYGVYQGGQTQTATTKKSNGPSVFED